MHLLDRPHDSTGLRARPIQPRQDANKRLAVTFFIHHCKIQETLNSLFRAYFERRLKRVTINLRIKVLTLPLRKGSNIRPTDTQDMLPAQQTESWR